MAVADQIQARSRRTGLLAWLRRLRAIVATALVISVLGLAVLAGLVNLLSPYADRFKPNVEAWLTQRIGQPVTLERLRPQWQLRGPRVEVEGLRIGADHAGSTGELYVGSANLGVDLVHWLDPRRRGVSFFQLVGDDIELTRDQGGRWRLSGLGEQAASSEQQASGLDWLLQQNSISLDARNFTLRDEIAGRALQVADVQLTFSNLQDRFIVTGRAGQAEIGELTFTAELDWPQQAASWRQARLRLKGDKLALPTWLAGINAGQVTVINGRASLELQAWLEPDRPSRAYGQTTITDLVLGSGQPIELGDGKQVAPRYALSELAGRFDFAQLASGWQLQLDQLRWMRGERRWRSAQLTLEQRDDAYSVAADFVRVEDVVDGLLLSAAVPAATRQALYELGPQGELSNLQLNGWRQDRPDIALAGQLRGGHWRPWGAVPGISGLDLDIRTVDQVVELAIDGRDVLLEYTQRLRWPLLLERVSGNAKWHTDQRGWRLEAPALSFINEPMAVDGSFVVNGGDGSRPFVDLRLDVRDGLIAHAERFWPIDRFSPRLLQWLDRSLIDGQISDGQLVLYGDLDDWPFADNQGRFEANANIVQTHLDYHPQWPALDNFDARMSFNAAGFTASLSEGQVAGIEVAAANGRLDSYRAPRLVLEIDGTADGAEMLELLRASPVPTEDMEQLTVAGPGRVRLDLELPLKPGLGERLVAGHVELERATIRDDRWDIQFDQSSGRLDYTDSGFQVADMQTRFRGSPARLSLRSGSFANDAANAIEADLIGAAPATTFSPDAPVLAPLLNSIVGTPQWHAAVSLPRLPSTSTGTTGTTLVIRSDLKGATTTLPVPLAKPAAQLMPIELHVPVGDASGDLLLTVADLGQLRLDPGHPSLRGKLVFGSSAQPLEHDQGLIVEGELSTIDLDGWREWLMPSLMASDKRSLDSRFLRAIDLMVGQARLSGRDFSNLSVKAAALERYWQVSLSGDQLDGRVRIPLQVNDQQLMLAEFERIEMPAAVGLDSTSTGSAATATLNPARYPPLQFIAEQLTLDGLDLGRVQVTAYPISDGMHVETFEASSATMRITASGDWRQLGDGQESVVSATMTAEDLGRLLNGFGVSGVVEGGQTLAKVDARWPGSPVDFDLSRLRGELSIDIGRGQITEVDPGAGRLIGLLSLQYLPRRLAFDFVDMFSSGLSFDSLKGSFLLDGGNARSDGIRIKGPTAEIQIAGRVGLAERDYDQTVTVTPKVSGALPLIGAIAGGPTGAAAGAVLQNVLKEPLGKMAEFRYVVTGPWDDPLIENLGSRELSTPSAEPAAGASDAESTSASGNGELDPAPEPPAEQPPPDLPPA